MLSIPEALWPTAFGIGFLNYRLGKWLIEYSTKWIPGFKLNKKEENAED